MYIKLFKTALATTFAVLLSLDTAFADSNSDCLDSFKQMKDAYTKSNMDATVVDTNPLRMNLFSLAHFNKGGVAYTSWKSLNDEVAGYALRNNKGFDYNSNRSYIGPLSWHQSLIWDKLFFNKNKLSGYECTLVGRTRLAGRKVSVLRINPIDEVRYSFIISKDEDTKLPVDLSILTPNKIVVSRFTVSAVHSAAPDNLSFPDETFDRVEKMQSVKFDDKELPWPELTIPSPFKIVASSTQIKDTENSLDYQAFSDGTLEFRVYKNTLTKLHIHSATDGTLTVFRKNSDSYEYAVVGEIPLELSNIILSKISANR
ncbi:MAG: hypothetical protein GX278_01115 [Aeromonadales bacterium]|nr:hypothetical protein [Aeromonadales bacterium]